MSIKTIDGVTLKEMILSGASLLESNRAEIDSLNVFPVPDGDTGTNMYQTIASAAKELQNHSYPTVGDVANAASKGALRGARGNSGVILSQILRGIAKALKGAEELDSALLIKAMRTGSDTAYKAVMKPKEGTILTVQRVIAETVESGDPSEDVIAVMEKIVISGNEILKHTPDMLPVLKQAGVVDSGGKGLVTLYTGFLKVLKGDTGDADEQSEAHKVDADEIKELNLEEIESEADIKFGYRCEFVIDPLKDTYADADISKLRRRLDRIGENVLVSKNLESLKIKITTNDPGRALQMSMELGEAKGVVIENLFDTFRRILEERKAEEARKLAESKQFGMVSVALGDGLVEVFRELTVDRIVDGGQTMNPSIDDLYQAIESVPAKEIFVLPNNTNIILAAQQAAKMSEKTVHVLPTKSVPMGIAAAIAFMPDLSGEENFNNMMEAAQKVHTASITYSVRDTLFDGYEIKEGDIMALIDNKLHNLGRDIREVVGEVLKDMVTEDTELITLYYGSDVSDEDAASLCDKVAGLYPACDVTAISGGQPLYYYLIAVE